MLINFVEFGNSPTKLEEVFVYRMPNKKKGFRHRRAEVRTLVKKQTAKRKLWGEQEMMAAIDTVVKGGLSRNQAADTHGVPRSTL